MAGIVSYGTYLPYYRIGIGDIAGIWSGNPGKGEKSVANWDEDSITMAVEAVSDSLGKLNADEIDGLLFASTRAPYALKQSASIVCAAVNLREDVKTADLAHSLRSGTAAFMAAADAVDAGSSRNVLVVASENQIAPMDSAEESQVGDGAAAFVIGNADIAVEIEHVHCQNSDMLDIWRLPQDQFNQSWEDRYVNNEGYLRIVKEAVGGFLEKFDLSLADFSKIVLSASNMRNHKAAVRSLGISSEQAADPLFDEIGSTGTASPLMMLASVLDESKAGDRILLVNYGDGADVISLIVTDKIKALQERCSLSRWLDSKKALSTYGNYLRIKRQTGYRVVRGPAEVTSLPMIQRDHKALVRLLGKRCKHCGHEQFPRMRICMWCQSKIETPAQYDDIELARQSGAVFSYSCDLRADVPDLPNVNCVVDLEGGARFYGMMTDRDPDQLQIGMTVQFTFRRVGFAQGVYHYYWKVRPPRK